MGLIRAAVGLLLLVLAFDFKAGDIPLWFVGAVGLMAQAGVLAGAALAPRLRKLFTEPRIIVGSLAVTCARRVRRPGSSAAWSAAALLSFILGATSGTAKQAFDALVQRDAPDANRGRSFARFETRFQLAWVMGAFIPVVLSGIGVPITVEVGYFLIGVLMAIGLVSYYFGQRRVAGGTYDWESPSPEAHPQGPAPRRSRPRSRPPPSSGSTPPPRRADGPPRPPPTASTAARRSPSATRPPPPPPPPAAVAARRRPGSRPRASCPARSTTRPTAGAHRPGRPAAVAATGARPPAAVRRRGGRAPTPRGRATASGAGRAAVDPTSRRCPFAGADPATASTTTRPTRRSTTAPPFAEPRWRDSHR